MLKDNIKLENIKGWLKVIAIEDNGTEHILVDKANALVSNAPTIIANALAGTSGWFLDTITALKTGSPLASIGVTPTFPAPGQVQFAGVFSTTSFNDTLDELDLSSTIGQGFSAVTGLSIFKGNTLQLSIQWLLTIS